MHEQNEDTIANEQSYSFVRSLPSLPALVPSEPLGSGKSEKTITDYLLTQHRSFEAVPFNPIDSLILSSLVYLDFDLVDFADVSSPEPVPMIDVLRFCDFDRLVALSWLKNSDDVPLFLDAFARNRRYAKLGCCLYVSEQSDNIDKQFAAVSFIAPGMGIYVAFRGTDGSVVGWKEDFALSYKEVIPSQRSAERYLSGVASCFPQASPLRVGGHSKGGNLAEFSSATVHVDVFHRISDIYNHDGPAFLNVPSPRYNGAEYQDKLSKFVPESSIFGMILEHSNNPKIVASNASSFFQHRPTSWLICGNDFKYCEIQSQSARFFDEALDSWLKCCTSSQRDAFLTAIFDLVEDTDCASWKEFQSQLPRNLAKVLRNTRNLDDQTKDAIFETLSHLANVLKDMTSDRVQGFLGKFFVR